MKRLLRWVVAALILFLCWMAHPVKAQAPSRSDLLKTIQHIEALAKETQNELDQEKAAHAQTSAALAAATKANDETQAQFKSYQSATESEIKKGNDAIAKLSGVVKKLHRAKWILCAEWLAICGFLALKFGKTPVIGTYLLFGVAGLAAAGISAIWLWV